MDSLVLEGKLPCGVRIGTAEIYRQVETLPEVLESLVVGHEWQGEERVILFVRLREGRVLDVALAGRIRNLPGLEIQQTGQRQGETRDTV